MMISRSSFAVVGAAAIVAIAVQTLLSSKGPHSEEGLLVDWSAPPPWPIFVAVTGLASLLRSVADLLTPPPVQVIEMTLSYQTSKLLQICQSYEIADFLATGPKTIREIAGFTNTAELIRVERIMYAMASMGITQLDPAASSQTGEPRFVNSPVSAALRRDHPNSMWAIVGHMGGEAYQAFGYLDRMLGPDPIDVPWDEVYAVGEGNRKYRGAKVWTYLQDHPPKEDRFAKAMYALEGLGGYAMANDGPFSRFDRIVDVGGSLGHFLYKILKLNPTARGVVFDLPHIVDMSRSFWETNFQDVYEQREAQRVDFIGGSFFDASTIPRRDVNRRDAYLLRNILHDWSDEQVVEILVNIRKAMTWNEDATATSTSARPATLLIGECAMPDRDRIGTPNIVYKVDMLMMYQFGSGAMERTPTMWKQLLERSGFELVSIHPTRSILHFIEAAPRDV